MALLAITFMRRPFLAQTSSVASVTKDTSLVAGTIGVGNAVVSENTGCENWHSSSLEVMWPGNESACVDHCRDTPGCVAANYQTSGCPDLPLVSTGLGACYLMDEECIEGPNECWNLYKMLEADRKPPQFGALVTRGAGCTNIDTITKGAPVKEFSHFVCQYKCERDPDCVGLLLKAPGCVASNEDNDDGEGQVCQLLYGLCEEDTSQEYACWDISYHQAVDTDRHPDHHNHHHKHHEDEDEDKDKSIDLPVLFYLQEDITEGSTIISVTNSTCFRLGDTIELFHTEEDLHHKYELTNTAPMTVSPPFTHTYHKGTGVLRIHFPYSASHCGDFPDN